MKKKLTEREELERNTQIAKAEQQLESFKEFLEDMVEDWDRAFRWEMRGFTWFMNVLFINIALDLYAIYMDMVEVLAREASLISIVVFVLLFRLLFFQQRRTYKEGKLDGAMATLRALGMLDDDTGDSVRRKIKRKSPFKRFKEFFERVGQSKSNEATA